MIRWRRTRPPYSANDDERTRRGRCLPGYHHIWHYVNFIVYLRMRDKTELTGPEQYVYKSLLARDHRCGCYGTAVMGTRAAWVR